MSTVPATGTRPLDAGSREWLHALRGEGATRHEAVARLHTLLLRAARFEAARRRAGFPHVRDELDEIAHEAAGDALIGVLARLDDFRGESRFTTAERVEQSELLSTLQTAIGELLTPHQRRVLIALTLNGVPIDVLADRLDTTRGALYKTLHDARRKLRAHLAERNVPLQ